MPKKKAKQVGDLVLETDWENVRKSDGNLLLKRFKVPGGWLVKAPKGGMAFYPDPHHIWLAEKNSLAQTLPQSETAPPPTARPETIPINLSWNEFQSSFKGAVVRGTVKHVHRTIGVFVYIGDFKGLIPHRLAPPGLNSGDLISVEIMKIYRRDDGREGINLGFISKP